MTDKDLAMLANKAMKIAVNAGWDYVHAAELTMPSQDALIEALKTSVKAAFPQALLDAKEAVEHGMFDIAEATFIASMQLAGIEAVKNVAQA